MTQSCRSNGVLPHMIVGYDQVLSTEHTNEILCVLSRIHLDRLTEEGWTAAGQFISDCIISGDFPSLCQYDPDVLDLSAADQRNLRQVLAFFGKRQDIELGIDREAAAWDKFLGAELSCKLVNIKFRHWQNGGFQFPSFVEGVLHTSMRKIAKLLGDAPAIGELRPRFGPGATTQVPKRNACPVTKLAKAPAVSTNLSEGCEAPLRTIFCTDGEICDMTVEIHDAQAAFVPKNAKTERSICTEPQLNGMFQLGIGDVIAERLRSVGIDIKDQSANQRAALYGSISGALATLDLSSASDTVSTAIVEHLLPMDWCDLLMLFRSDAVGLKGERFEMQKISSMGNGFTFPLETLIFWALAQSVTDVCCPRTQRRVLVYGDDIIVPTAAAVPLMEVLTALGFQVNAKKSFWTGRFRESCGKDYVFGSDVRPVYVDNQLTGLDVFRLHNFFWERGDFQIADVLESLIHPTVRLYGPQGYGDGHLNSTRWAAKPEGRSKGWGGYTFETWAFSAKSLKKELAARFANRVKPKLPPDRPKGQPPEQGCLEWTSRSFALVKRVATYVAYTREGTATAEQYGPIVLGKGSSWSPKNGFDPLSPRPPQGTKAWRSWNRSRLRELALFYQDGGTPSRRDDDILAVPGRGECVRTKVYTFEPPQEY